MMELQGRVTVITGGASGIGAACARAFSLEGAKVVIADVNVEGARAVADDIGAIAIACDVGKEEDVGSLVEMTEKEVGTIDVFFSNAAVATGGDPISTPVDTWQQQWQINVMGHVYAVRAVLPAMLARGEGYLVHTASMAGILTSQGNVTYATTKHAVVGLAEWLSITYHDQGIRTSLLAPLGVNTPMLGGGNSPFARTAAGPVKEPEDVAEMVVRAIRDERFLILTDEIAQTWMERKTNDLDRWLHGMRRLQRKIDELG
ncbi:MAG: SDR family oxidoreductase [Pseudomonadales bacterium]|nr:SDR family oxidoreductase [Pseudomonadales bacterium]